MMSSLSFRAAIAAAVLAVVGSSQAQTVVPGPAAPQGAAQPNPQATTPPAGVGGAGAEPPATSGVPGGQPPKRNTGRNNYMPANPDASPIVPGQPPTSRGTGAGSPGYAQSPAGSQGSGAKGGGKGRTDPRPMGMGRAFKNLQTQEELAAYSVKAKAVKTYAECRTLLETTKKELEPRAKAENKPMTVNPTEICDKAKERGRFTG